MERHRDLVLARVLTLGPVVLAFPLGTIAVFHAGANRGVTADVIAWTYSFGLFAAFTTSLWPLPSLRSWDRVRRVQSAVLLFLVVSYLTHLTWELGWLCLHERIAAARDAVVGLPVVGVHRRRGLEIRTRAGNAVGDRGALRRQRPGRV